jgi:asparagine synthase (glutamine-hydrolysing)
MCGIAGILEFDRGAHPDGNLLHRMTELIAHRGPDDSGHFIRDNVALGHRRLSVIDLSPSGHQPMSNDDGSAWITYNGECYNYRELAARLRRRGHRFRSTSDTEVILRLYEEKGEAFLDELDGMFALAIWDRRRRQLLLARDRLGIKPLFYFADNRHFIFASELKALLADPAIAVELDVAALSDYLHLLSIPDPHSILAGVRKLLPGHFLKVGESGIELKKYWDLRIAIDPAISPDAASEQFESRFRAAVASHMVADVPVGAFLSGGVDSSSVVSAASREAKVPVETFSVVFPGLTEFDESSFAAAVAARCGTRHHEFSLTPTLVESLPTIAWHADEPFGISSSFALFYLAQLARNHVKVVLSGDGGDEAFAGYPGRHVDYPNSALLFRGRGTALLGRILRSSPMTNWVPPAIRSRIWRIGSGDTRYVKSFSCFGDAELAELLEPDYAAAVAQAWEHNITQRYFNTAPTTEQLSRKLYTDVKTTLVSEMLTKVDRMTMAHGLEARVPFLDHHLVEWAFTVPAACKIDGTEGKLIIKKAMQRHLPHEILYREKRGFNVPMKLWMRDELRDFVHDMLTGPRFRQRGLFRPGGVLRLLDAHFTGSSESSNKIISLLMLELWFRQIADARAAHAQSSGVAAG